MNLSFKTSANNIPKLTYDVLVENQPNGTVRATLIGLPDCQGLGNTEAEAIEKLSQSLQNRLESAKILTLEVEAEASQSPNPWLKFAGMHKDNPLFDEVIAYIEEERNAIDAQVEEGNAKFINEIEQGFEKLGWKTNIDDVDIVAKVLYLIQRNQGVFTTNDEENNS